MSDLRERVQSALEEYRGHRIGDLIAELDRRRLDLEALSSLSVERLIALRAALRDLLCYARATVPWPVDVGERNAIARAEDLLKDDANG